MGSLLEFSKTLLLVVYWQCIIFGPSGFPLVGAQIDGSFWWMNTNLIKKAEDYREEKDVKAIVVNNETEIDSIRLSENILSETSDDTPDCICVPSNRCRSTAGGAVARDGLCGRGNTCCRRTFVIPQHHTSSPPQTSFAGSSSYAVATSSAHQTPIINLNPTLNVTPPQAIPDLALLNEISSLLQQINSPSGQLLQPQQQQQQFEPEAEFIFDSIPATQPTTVRPTPVTKPTPAAISQSQTPKPKKCGRRQMAISSRVYFPDDDGESLEENRSGSVSFGEFPWTVYIEERIHNGSFVYKCGGALITPRAVVTVGHCVANARNNPASFRVVAGDWDRRHNQEKLPSQLQTVDRIVLHHNYYSGSLYNDIAILIFNSSFNDSTRNVGHVCLPSAGDTFQESDCLLSGWGATPKNPEKEEPIQRFVSMNLIESNVCQTRMQTSSPLGRRFRLHESVLCAGGVHGVDSCKGSGGSPLVCAKNGAYTLAGLMSWGIGCGKETPGVFASVAYHSTWMKYIVDGLEDNVVYFV